MQSSQSGQWNSPQGRPPQGIHGHGYGPDPHLMPFPPRQHENYYAPVNMPPQLDRQLHQGISAYGREPPVATIFPSNPPSMAPQVTQHMQVPLQYADSVIGANGSTMSYIRRASGATVTIQETRGVPGEMTVEINGTASQVQAAQQLVQNFMADADAAAAIAATAATQTGGATDQQVYSQGYSAYAAAAPPGTAYGSAPSTAGPPAQPGAYGSVYGGNYGYF